jgi:2'-5' RNA ligase
MEGRGNGFSLWLMPEGASYERLTKLVSGLAVRLGTAAFVPHITLLAGLPGEEADLVPRAQTLAAQLPRLRVPLREVEGRDEYFRCLYVTADPATSLRAAHARAAEAFGRRPDPDFLPHLSLVYGHLPAGEKARIGASVRPDLPAAFEAAFLHVWRTEGAVGEWASRARFELRGLQGEASNSSSARRNDRGSTAG